jgi:hypothetical protein
VIGKERRVLDRRAPVVGKIFAGSSGLELSGEIEKTRGMRAALIAAGLLGASCVI